MSLLDEELSRITFLESRLNEIELQFHILKISDVSKLRDFLLDIDNARNQLYIRVGTYRSATRQKIISDVNTWFDKLDYKVLMRIENTTLIRKEVIQRKYDKISYMNELLSDSNAKINEIKRVGWSDSFLSLKPKKTEYEKKLLIATRSVEYAKKWILENKWYVDYLNVVLDVSNRYSREISNIDSEIKAIKKAASDRAKKAAFDAKLSKAARVDGKIRAQVSPFRRAIKKTEKCPYCSSQLGNKPQLDHIYPVSKGGLNLSENLVFCCITCNTNKSDKSLRQFCIEMKLDYLEVTDRLASMGKHV